MIHTDPDIAAPLFRAQIAPARRILLLTHVNPDGDAVGSMLGAAHVLRAIGKEPLCLLSSPAPSYCLRLPGAEWLRVFHPGDALPVADLTWMLDTATPQRVGPIADVHLPELLKQPLLITDHHVTNDGGGSLNLIDPRAASTADLLFRLLRAMALPVGPEAATCLYLGLTTDTQSFQTSNTSPQTLRTAADILASGADLRAVITAVYFSIPESTMRLTALVLSDMRREGPLAWASVTLTHLAATGAGDEATDDTIMRMQRIDGVRLCALFKERDAATVKLSLRSTPDIDVSIIAQRLGGGGHAQAAGATLHMGLDEARATVLPMLRAELGHGTIRP